jgi:glucokinase
MSRPSSDVSTPGPVIGVDVGGTTAKMALVTGDGKLLHRLEIEMPHDHPADELVARLDRAIGDLVEWAKGQGTPATGIGVSVCGFVTPSGDALDYINIHVLDGYPLKGHLEDLFELPVVLDNDMNCAALGEYHFGAGRGVNRLLVVTVGTGIGVGAVLEGQVVRMTAGTTGNPGHVIVHPEGPVCVAGCRGCVESLASAGPISRRAEDLAHSQRSTLLAEMLAEKGCLTPEDVFHAAEAGDPSAQEVWEYAGRWLGRGLATWVQLFGPEVVLIGGGVARAGAWLLDPIEREMRLTGEPYFTRQVRAVKRAAHTKDLGILGAASLLTQAGRATTE